ncbi:MAG: hypothetical protein JO077_08705 [Verrucomicrobia bacterium]|nr:hypothetical protein [Verrucomicrobiota bacterium]
MRVMKGDLYTKVVLTVIAACLVGILFRDVPVITTAQAAPGDLGNPLHVIIDGLLNPGGLPVTNAHDYKKGTVPLLVQSQ